MNQGSHPNIISPSFCGFAFKQLHVTPAGVVKPCCLFDGALRNDKEEPFVFGEVDIETIWNSSHLRSIRSKMIDGEQIPECTKCMEEEALTSSSDRLIGGKYFSYDKYRIKEALFNEGSIQHLPRMLNLKIGNICNLKCRMCQPLDSNKIDIEFESIAKKFPAFRHFDNTSAFDYYRKGLPLSEATAWIENTQAMDNIKKVIQFTYEQKMTLDLGLAGGETLLTPQILALLDFCINTGISRKIELSLSTNLTKLTDGHLEKLNMFYRVVVMCSIDGVGRTLEYIRYPSEWETVYLNYKKLLSAKYQNILPVLAPTVQIYNVLEIHKVLEIAEGIDLEKFDRINLSPVFLTLLCFPRHLNLRYLPQEIKNIAYLRLLDFKKHSKLLKKFTKYAEQFDSLLNFVLTEKSSSDDLNIENEENIDLEKRYYLSLFLQYTQCLDQERSQKMEIELPELYKELCKFQIKPEFPQAHGRSFTYYSLRDYGIGAMKMGQLEVAYKYFSKSYVLVKDDPVLNQHYFRCLKALNKIQELKTLLLEMPLS